MAAVASCWREGLLSWRIELLLGDYVVVRITIVSSCTIGISIGDVVKVIVELHLLNAEIDRVCSIMRYCILTVISNFHLLIALYGT